MDYLELINISDMAMHRADFVRSVNNDAKQLILHLLRIRMYPNARCIDHWRDEVEEKTVDHCDTIFKSKHVNKTEAAREGLIYRYNPKLNQDKVDEYVFLVKRFESDLVPSVTDVSVQEVYSWLEKFAELIGSSNKQALLDYIKEFR